MQFTNKQLEWTFVSHCFNTVNGIRVHAIEINPVEILDLERFNTVNGIRVHAISIRFISLLIKYWFQYRKRYKGACN